MGINIEFKNDPYAEMYGLVYTDKMNYLAKVITDYQTEQNQFNVLNFEAGDQIIYECVNDWNNKSKFLIVKRFNDEADKSLEVIESGFTKDAAVAINAENWSKEWKGNLDTLKRKKVIFISHQRYIDLCVDDTMRKVFSEDRDILIIDEKINFPVFTYNDKYYTKIIAILPNSIRNELMKVCKPLNNTLAKMEANKRTNQCVRIEAGIHPATLENFKKLIEVNMENYTIRGQDDRKIIETFMEGLELWYSKQSIYNAGNISTNNPKHKHKHWGLNNNIILDASAAIDGVYKINPEKYRLIPQIRVVDHSNCAFHMINFNSSKTKIKEYRQDYYSEIIQKINNYRKVEDKTLIVCHKDNVETIRKHLIKVIPVQEVWVDKVDKTNDLSYSNQSIAIAWYGNLIGKNEFKDFTQVWILGTPNIPHEQYLVHYLQYSDKYFGNRSIDVVKGRFKNDQFRTVQVGYVASEIYQSIKRIQRNVNPKGEFFIVNNDEEILSMVLSQIKGAKLSDKPIELMFIKEKEEEKKSNKKPGQVQQFIDYILSQPKGIYPKSEITKNLRISKINRVLLDARVKALLPNVTKQIQVHNKTIERL